MKKHLAIFALALACVGFSFEADAQRGTQKVKQGKICGNPNLKCRTGDTTYEPYELPFETPRGNQVITESEPFYGIVLKSVKLKKDGSDCETAISEDERLEAQNLFPNNKVFAEKCVDADGIFYMYGNGDVSYMAVYAGKTLAAAKAFLKTVQTNDKFKGAYIRKMQAQFNGT